LLAVPATMLRGVLRSVADLQEAFNRRRQA
jgi:hypothetical protein